MARGTAVDLSLVLVSLKRSRLPESGQPAVENGCFSTMRTDNRNDHLRPCPQYPTLHRPRGQFPKKAEQSTEAVEWKVPEYIKAHEVNALLRVAPNPWARLLMMIEWRARLRVPEALALSTKCPAQFLSSRTKFILIYLQYKSNL